jgi:RHS repeat-associated protein
MLIPGRTFSSSSYRYGFNGKENDNDPKGIEGSQQDYGMRIYDPRAGRFLSVDPISNKYPELTPYQFASNTPIAAIDIDGKEAGLYQNGAIGASGTPLSSYFGNEKGREQWGKAMGTGIAVGGAAVVDVFFTKGWLTRTLLASQIFGAFEHNRAKTGEGRVAQDQRSKAALADAAYTLGAGKMLGVVFNTGVSALKGLAKARFNFAKEFYNQAGYSEERFLQHSSGIDLANKLGEQTFEKGTILEQWRRINPKTGEFMPGDYYALPGADPTKLGVYIGDRVKFKIQLQEKTTFLKSTASDITDTWSKPGQAIDVKGGETQLFQSNVKGTVVK